jgi:hypothetical protein
MSKKQATDWAAIEAAYTLGTASIRQIARDHGVTDTAIRKKAKADGWVRTVVATANQDEDECGIGGLDGEILTGRASPLPEDHGDAILQLAGRMLDEIHGVTSHLGEIEQAIIDETEKDRSPKRRAAMLKAISLGGRAMALKTVTQAVVMVKADVRAKEEAKGKKERQKEEAQDLAQNGRFATPSGPKLAVDNSRK